MQTCRAARCHLGNTVHGTGERFSMAGAHAETGRINAAIEIANSSLVDDVDLRPDAPASTIVTSPEARRSRRSRHSFYERQFRRTQRRGSLSSPYLLLSFPIFLAFLF